MKEGRTKTEEGPRGRPKNTLRSPASGVIRGGGIVLYPQERRGRCGCMLWWWRVDGCVVEAYCGRQGGAIRCDMGSRQAVGNDFKTDGAEAKRSTKGGLKLLLQISSASA